MSTPRRPLGPIHPNRIQRKELTPCKRGQIVGVAKVGAKPTAIAKALKTTKSTVKTTLHRDPIRTNGVSLPRSGRPKIWTNGDVRRLVRCVQLHPKYTYAQV